MDEVVMLIEIGVHLTEAGLAFAGTVVIAGAAVAGVLVEVFRRRGE